MKFDYQARTQSGEIINGQLESGSRQSALEHLQEKGYYVTSLTLFEELPFWRRPISSGKIKDQDKVAFAHQLAIMFRSSIPLTEALKTIAKQTKNQAFKDAIGKVAKDVEGGAPTSQALAQYPKAFDPFFVNMVKAGEVSGKLSENLENLALHMEKEKNLKDKVRGAVIYPIFILAVFIVIFSAMAFFVIPQFEKVLEVQSGEKLPGITLVVFGMARFLRENFITFFLMLAFVVLILIQASKTKDGKMFLDKNLIKFPLVGDLIKKIQISTFAESLSTLISAGLPISQSLEITADVVSNVVYKDIVLEMRDEVRRGSPMSAVLMSYPEIIPPLLTQMVVVGERTGNLEQALTKVVNFYQEEVWRTTDNLISLIEPILIVVLGIAVMLFAVSVFFPIFSTMNQI
ncbi:MAG TPA: type II secretion system F family protein [Candidatus Pacearchaeota archaeon]|nr:type II secretion system F family protein [Candidatus Pacearchaeota archaeon]